MSSGSGEDRGLESAPGARRSGVGQGWLARWGRFLRDQAVFLPALWRSPRTVGAICPSSRALARAMIAGSCLSKASLVVELGPGTGAITRVILEALGAGVEFFALEVDAGAVRHLRQRFPGVQILHDSAEHLLEHVRPSRQGRADYIISGLPWAILPEDVQQRIMEGVASALRPGGVFTTFAYLHARRSSAGQRYWRMLPAFFSQVTVSRPVWWNLPPAVVYRCVR